MDPKEEARAELYAVSSNEIVDYDEWSLAHDKWLDACAEEVEEN